MFSPLPKKTHIHEGSLLLSHNSSPTPPSCGSAAVQQPGLFTKRRKKKKKEKETLNFVSPYIKCLCMVTPVLAVSSLEGVCQERQYLGGKQTILWNPALCLKGIIIISTRSERRMCEQKGCNRHDVAASKRISLLFCDDSILALRDRTRLQACCTPQITQTEETAGLLS